VVTPSTGSVVLLPFPFSDLSQSKKRPAVVLARASRDDWILCQVTSNPYGDLQAVTLSDQSFERGSLLRTSYARPGKLFTANRGLLLRQVGVLNPEAVKKIVEVVVEILRSGLRS
jgi:PemK-like, MazF-like toxin of type II toxin-antitoxin system